MEEPDPDRPPPWSRPIAGTIGAAVVILVAGVVLTRSAEVIAWQSGLGTGIVGLTLLAVATSLPELSSTFEAVRLRRTELAIGNVLGGNMIDVTLIFLVDAVYVGPPVLNEVDGTAGVAAMLAILLTCFLLVGLIERRDRALFKMGYDSHAILLTYAGGVGLLFWMSGA